MAITKPYAAPNGVVASYHKLQHIEFSTASLMLTLTFAVYYTEEARQRGLTPLYYERVFIPVSDLNQDPRNVFYPMALEHWASFAKDGQSDTSDMEETEDRTLRITEAATVQPAPPEPPATEGDEPPSVP